MVPSTAASDGKIMLRQKSFQKELLFPWIGVSANGVAGRSVMSQPARGRGIRQASGFTGETKWLPVPAIEKNIVCIKFLSKCLINSSSIKITLIEEMRRMSCYGWIHTTGLDAHLHMLLQKAIFFFLTLMFHIGKYLIFTFVTNSKIDLKRASYVEREERTALTKSMSKVNSLDILWKGSKCCLFHDSKNTWSACLDYTHIWLLSDLHPIYFHLWC